MMINSFCVKPGCGKPIRIDTSEHVECQTCDLGRDPPISFNLGVVADAPQESIGNARRTTRSGRYLPGAGFIHRNIHDLR